jgi:hypothetical protein
MSDNMSSSFSTTPKELWCFACNSMKITHCNMCDMIKAMVMRTNGMLR